MASSKYLFFESRYKEIEQIKETEKIKITLVFYEKIQATCILKQYKNRDLSDVCEALMKIRNPNIAIVYDYVYEDGSTYAIEELVVGRTLSEMLEDKGVFSEKETRRIICDVCNGLKDFHSQKPPIVHNDIKTSNIMIRDDGCVKLIDFDITRTYKIGAEKNTHLYGTEEYASPEHFGFGQSEPRSDIYSLGVTMHEMLTGESLDGEHEITYKGKIAKIIKKCVNVDRKKRYSTVKQLKRHLEKNAYKIKILIVSFIVVFILGAFCGFQVAKVSQNNKAENKPSQNTSITNKSEKTEKNTQSNDDALKEEEKQVLDVEKLKMKSSAKTEGVISSIVIHDGKEISIEKIGSVYYIFNGDSRKELADVNPYHGCKLIYEPYKDSLYLFSKGSGEITVYSVTSDLVLTEKARLNDYSSLPIIDTTSSFYPDGLMISDIFYDELIDSNTWTKIGECKGGAYVIKDKLYEIVHEEWKLKGFVEVDAQGNFIKEYIPEISFLETNTDDMNVYIDETGIYFIATIDEKEYVYHFDGTQYKEIICLNDYQYYSKFKYNCLFVNEEIVMCYDTSARVIKKFAIK